MLIEHPRVGLLWPSVAKVRNVFDHFVVYRRVGYDLLVWGQHAPQVVALVGERWKVLLAVHNGLVEQRIEQGRLMKGRVAGQLIVGSVAGLRLHRQEGGHLTKHRMFVVYVGIEGHARAFSVLGRARYRMLAISRSYFLESYSQRIENGMRKGAIVLVVVGNVWAVLFFGLGLLRHLIFVARLIVRRCGGRARLGAIQLRSVELLFSRIRIWLREVRRGRLID